MNINTSYIQGYAGLIIGFINSILVPLLLAVALLVFVWGIVKSFFLEGDKGREAGRMLILYGIIGFVVILSVWGLVALLANTFGLAPGSAAPPYPVLH